MGMSSRFRRFAVVLACVAAAGVVTSAQIRGGITPNEADIIRRFTQAESQLREARTSYTFKQDVLMQTMVKTSAGPSVTGVFHRVSEIIFTDAGQRTERITYFPPSTLKTLVVTQTDLEDLGIIQPFALTAEELPKYNVQMVGRETIDEIPTYVFDVSPKDPKGMEKRGERFFAGRVWVEDQDFMIVKVAGKAGPEVGNNRYPRFETYRENIDGKYWFPTYTYADDVLQFETSDIPIRLVVKYTNYRQFTGTITVLPDDGSEPQPQPPPDDDLPPPIQAPPPIRP